jgi:1,4-dihydroxy-2-naphthoyl-CoA hydrolase
MIWKQAPDMELLKEKHKKTMIEHLGIEFVEFGPDFIRAKMPVDERTKQPDGILHGGASVVLAETLGSIAGWLLVNDQATQSVVGLEINASHLAMAVDGEVLGEVRPIKIGKKVQVWDIRITQEEKLICQSRLTTVAINRRQ